MERPRSGSHNEVAVKRRGETEDNIMPRRGDKEQYEVVVRRGDTEQVAPVYILYNILINIVLTDNNNRAPRTTESYSQEAQMNPSNTGSSMRGDLLNVFRLLFLAAKLIFFHIPLVIFYHIPRYIYQTVHDIVVTLYNVYCAVCFIVDSTQTMLYYVYYALCNLCRISYFLLYALRLSVFDNLSYIILYAVYFSFQTFYYTLLVISAVLAFYHAFYFSQQQN